MRRLALVSAGGTWLLLGELDGEALRRPMILQPVAMPMAPAHGFRGPTWASSLVLSRLPVPSLPLAALTLLWTGAADAAPELAQAYERAVGEARVLMPPTPRPA